MRNFHLVRLTEDVFGIDVGIGYDPEFTQLIKKGNSLLLVQSETDNTYVIIEMYTSFEDIYRKLFELYRSNCNMYDLFIVRVPFGSNTFSIDDGTNRHILLCTYDDGKFPSLYATKALNHIFRNTDRFRRRNDAILHFKKMQFISGNIIVNHSSFTRTRASLNIF